MSNITWCQNPKCPEKQTSGQIRGTKGKKYYQSNKAYGYLGGLCCTQGCADCWANIYYPYILSGRTIPVIREAIKINMENSWHVEFDYQSYRENNTSDRYYLINQLHNIRHEITKQQAEINPQESYSPHITSAQAGVLAKKLGLTNQ